MRIRSIAVASALAASVGLFAIAAPASAAPPGCGFTYMTPVLVAGQFVEASGEIACTDPNNPNDGRPLEVTLQQSPGGNLWTTVAPGAGDALYRCVGTQTRAYRLREKSSVVVHLACN
jgi:hypothetical protein